MARSIRLTFHGTILLVTLTVLGVMSAAPARQAFEQHQQIRRHEAKLAALQSENLRLEQRLARLNDPDYVEKLAREELGLVKPGETSYVIVPGPTQTATAKAPPPKKSWNQRIFDWFRSLF